MPTRATASFFFLFFFLLPAAFPAASLSAAFSRRVLHQPFFPADPSQPPSQPPSPSPPKYPFSGTTTTPPADRSPFFPADPTSPTAPPPPPPPSAAGLTSAPVNISSLAFPRPTSSHRPLPSTLIAITAALALCAVSLIVVSLLFYLRSRRRHRFPDEHEEKSAPSRSNPPETLTVPPKRTNTNNSSEFLYLGTLPNPRGVDVAANNGGAARRGNGLGGFEPRKLDSPELHPLPPLARQSMRQNVETRFAADREDEDDSYYSPRGSTSGRESSLAAGSGSRRVFAAVQAGRNESSESSSSSGSSSSDSCSPARSASLSISPPASASPKSSKPKSPDYILEPQAPTTSVAPPSPQLPPMSFGHSAPPPKEEAEDSPLLINGSNSSRMSSPVESPRLSPLWAMGGRISPAPARDSPDYDRNQLSPTSDGSISSRKSSSIKLPRFLGGGSRKYSPESSSPNSISSPISPTMSTTSRSSSSRISNSVAPNGRSYPTSPSLRADSGRRRHSTPASPAASSRRVRPSSPELHRLSNVSDHSKSTPLAPPQAPAAPAPPPPPPPAMRRSGSPVSQTPVGDKPRLKPLHWDKLRASSDCEMVWDHLQSSSFKVNEEMIETLFVVNNPNPKMKDTGLNPVHLPQEQENMVLDPKKAQNIAILLRALNVSSEEVCEALLEGNARALGTELLECLLKMAPSKEEEWKLKEYKDDSPRKLGHAERFLKTIIDIPFAFKRVEAMLYVTNFESEVEYLKKSFETLEAACDELRNSRMFLKLLEAVLKTGNRMNVGTNRGDAQAFKLDTLLKLVDIKAADGKTTLLHFVVQEIIRAEGARHCSTNQAPQQPITATDDSKCIRLGLQVVSSLSSELANVKKAAGMDSDALSSEVVKLSRGLAHIAEVVRLNEMMGPEESCGKFSESMKLFMRMAEEETSRVQAHERVALSLVKEITEYFHGNSAKEEAHPLRIFMVVREFLGVLDRVCKEVGAAVAWAHRAPAPVNPVLPVPVNPMLTQYVNGFQYGM